MRKSLAAEFLHRHRTREEFRRGLANGEVVFHYQPRVDMCTGAVLGAEALVRWQQDQNSDRPPAEWLPVIEAEAGLSAELGRHALASVVTQLARWREKGLDLLVSVNVSARHLQMSGFLEDVRHALSRRPDLAPYISLEVPETALVEDAGRVAQVLASCRSLRLRVALDNFGTGHASLASLQTLPADVIKLDVGFVLSMPWEMRAFRMVAGTLQMTQMLGMEVVAEGVETEEHGKRLLQLGSPLAQGFAISPALPPDAFEKWLKTWRAPAAWTKERAVPIMPISHRLLAALVYHRGQEEIVFADGGTEFSATKGRKTCCPLQSGEDIRDIPKALHTLDRELHRLEDAALSGYRQGANPLPVNTDEWREYIIAFERMIDDELSSP